MNVENQRGSLTGEGAGSDRFPAGMRVLAVDDDPICLKVLDNLLRKCQYKVTVTNEAVKALRLLRENKTKFDIVISDVNMPDMDGFNLLEHVGLELDLPVIMLSAHCDTELVMKGIVHGACDYLLKPVRIEELKNIWQHVVRKRKQDRRDQKRSINQENLQSGSAESEYVAVRAGNSSSDQNAREIRKRKDDDKVEGEEDGENDNNENEESSTQKKPRVVWSVELHRKFVAAVNQLGLDKAVPKKILDLMEVEGLTRENVASHLQKYRLYLKRINVTSQHVNMVGPLGSRDSSYMQLVPSSQTSYGDFSSLGGGSTLLSSSPIPSYQPPGMFGQLNSNAGLTIRGIASSPMIQQPVHSQQMLTNSYNTLGRPNQPLQHGNRTTHLGDFNQINDPTDFASPAIMSCPPNNALVLHGSNNPQQVPNNAVFGCPSSLGVMNMEPFNHNPVQLPKFPSSSLPLTEASEDPRGNMQCQTGLMGNVFQNMNNREDYNPTLNSSFSSINSIASGTSGMGPFTLTMDQSGVNNRVEASLNNQMNSSVVPYVPQAAVDRPDGLAQTNFESFDDIMSVVLKRDQNENMLLDGDLGFDAYNLL